MKTYQLIKDLPNSNIKAGNLYTLNSEGLYVDDFGNKFKPESVENSSEYFKETSLTPEAPTQSQSIPPTPEPQQARPLTQPVQNAPMQPYSLTRAFEFQQPQQPQNLPPGYIQPPQPNQFWKPEPGDQFFCVNGDGELRMMMWQNQPMFYKLYQFGNVFRSQVEAQQAMDAVRQALNQMRIRFYGGIAALNAPGAPMMPQMPTPPAYSPYQPQFYPQPQYPPNYPPPDLNAHLRAQPDAPTAPPAAFRPKAVTLPYEIPPQ